MSDWKSKVQKLKQDKYERINYKPTNLEGFTIFCSLLSDEEWKSFIIDIVKNPSEISKELSIPRKSRALNEEVIVAIVSDFEYLSKSALSNLSRVLEAQFLTPILKSEIDDIDINFIDNIFYIIFTTPVIIKAEILRKISQKKTLPLDTRFDAASRLYSQKIKTGKEYWMQLAKNNPDSRLAPLAIAALAETNLKWVWELIETLELNEIPNKFKLNYKTSFRTFIREYKKSKQEEISIDFPKEQLPEWSQKCIDDILNEREFYNKIVANEPSLEKVTVGIAPFLDTMIFKLGVDEGIYRDQGLDIDIEPCKWNSIFDELSDRKVDVIIGNKQLCNYYNLQSKNDFDSVSNTFYYSQDLFLYKGFAILINSDTGLKTYTKILDHLLREVTQDFKSEKRETFELSKADVFRETVKQLKGKKILASSTDHAVTFIRCAERCGLKYDEEIKDFELISQYDPNEGMLIFLNNEEFADAYVGGIPQRIIANKYQHIEELITYQQINEVGDNFANNRLRQENGFITLRETHHARRQLLKKLDRGWFETIGLITDEINIKKDDKLVRRLVCEYNKTLDSFEENNNLHAENLQARITPEDFKKYIWLKWEEFPTTPKTIRDMASMEDQSAVTTEIKEDGFNAIAIKT